MKLRTLALPFGLAAAFFIVGGTGAALAQQPPPPPPAGGPPIQITGPNGQPLPNGIQIRKIDPSELPPQFRQPGGPAAPGALGAPGGPGGRPGGPGRPNLPPGFNPRRPVQAAPPPRPAEPVEEEAKDAEECPGHGPTQPPHAPNWWQGLLMVDNERAESPSFLNRLFFRYENKKDPCDPKNMPPPFLATVINFGVLALVLYRFGRKPLAEALVKRRAEIMGEIDTAEKLKRDAERRLAEYEEKLEKIEDTLEQLRAEFAAQAEQEKKHVLAEAEERRVRMRKDAEFRIEQESKTARVVLLEEAVIGAVTAAETLLVAKVASGDLDRMAEEYLASVGPALKPGLAAPQGDRR